MKHLTVRQHTWIHNGWNILAIVLALPNFFLENKALWTIWLAIGCVLISVIWRVVFIKCPNCGDRFTGSRVFPKTCPNCGKSLNEKPAEE